MDGARFAAEHPLAVERFHLVLLYSVLSLFTLYTILDKANMGFYDFFCTLYEIVFFFYRVLLVAVNDLLEVIDVPHREASAYFTWKDVVYFIANFFAFGHWLPPMPIVEPVDTHGWMWRRSFLDPMFSRQPTAEDLAEIMHANRCCIFVNGVEYETWPELSDITNIFYHVPSLNVNITNTDYVNQGTYALEIDARLAEAPAADAIPMMPLC